ncbi:hypothetical protein HYH02_005585 [Chlamydomonas schloesseri]|uniref:Uncharacterized protein n=1 Tax=Chlamydomonas schloesseri TaxID=2026947 RepID=A0A836B750_9CHLO|nr:hypothetical protein HYH02_005585 [Chlamydomonas schloesseri]|eukprot:KAG2449438.1 hypothetical protein HYH02_005585 [Chlamydomonas schloesseri]
MPAKKKSGDGVKKLKKPTPPLEPFDFTPPTIYELGVKPSLFVRCRICCTALPHLNFEWPAVPTELALGAIKEAVVKRHGGALPQLTLFKDVVHPEHSLAGASDGDTLKDIGIEGVHMGEGVTLPSVTFHYDFAAARFDDSIVAVEPDPLESKHDLSLKLYRRLTAGGRGAAGGAGTAGGAAAGRAAGSTAGMSGGAAGSRVLGSPLAAK